MRTGLVGCLGAFVLLVTVLVVVPSAAQAGSFTDVPSTHPYATAIGRLADLDIIAGYPDGRFGPDAPVTRAQFAKMVSGTFGLYIWEADEPPFADVPTVAGNPYPDDYIRVISHYGITQGVSPTAFGPNREITRAQVITMIVRAFRSLRPNHLSRLALMGFQSSWGEFDSIHAGNAAKAEANKLLTGLPLPTLGPWGTTTRGEVGQILSNVLDNLADPMGRIFFTQDVSETDLVTAIEEDLDAQAWRRGSRPAIYLPLFLPTGYSLAASYQPFLFGGFGCMDDAKNPFVGEEGEPDYCVVFTNGSHNLVLCVGRSPVSVLDFGFSAYHSFEMASSHYGTVLMSGSFPGGEQVYILTYREDLPAACALSDWVREVAPRVGQ